MLRIIPHIACKIQMIFSILHKVFITKCLLLNPNLRAAIIPISSKGFNIFSVYDHNSKYIIVCLAM